jgi:uncharacterized protein
MPYPVLIRGVLDALADSVVLSDTLPLEDVHLGSDVFSATAPTSFRVTVTNVGDGLIAVGEVRATLRTTCVRCLCEFEMEVVGEVDGFFVRPEDEASLPDEQDRELIVDERIDLEPLVAQSLVVALPFAPVHSPECAGICPTCGADRNLADCGCRPEGATSPFAKLKASFPDAAAPTDETA